MSYEMAGRVIRETRGRGYIHIERAHIDVTGSPNAAIFLSEAISLSYAHADEEGWFYRTQKQWEDSVRLTRREQETVRQQLCKLGVLEEERRGVPAKLFFRVDEDRLAELVLALPSTDKYGGKRHTRMDESDTPVRRKTPITNKELNTNNNTTCSSDLPEASNAVISPPVGGDGGDFVASDSPPKPTKTERDAMWDAVVEFANVEPMTRQEKSNLGGVVKELLEAGLTPRHVRIAGKEWDRLWGTRTKTYRALVTYISTLLVSRQEWRDSRDAGKSPMDNFS